MGKWKNEVSNETQKGKCFRDNHKDLAMEARAVLPLQHYFFQDWVLHIIKNNNKKIEFCNWVSFFYFFGRRYLFLQTDGLGCFIDIWRLGSIDFHLEALWFFLIFNWWIVGPCNPTISIGFDQVGREVRVDMIVTFFLHIIEIWMYWIFCSGCGWLFLAC